MICDSLGKRRDEQNNDKSAILTIEFDNIQRTKDSILYENRWIIQVVDGETAKYLLRHAKCFCSRRASFKGIELDGERQMFRPWTELMDADRQKEKEAKEREKAANSVVFDLNRMKNYVASQEKKQTKKKKKKELTKKKLGEYAAATT